MATSGLAVIGAVALLLISGAPRGQTRPDPSESAIATPQPDEVPAPQDHVMASQCLAEVRARFPAATYDFLDIAFSRSKALGDIIRIDFADGNVAARDEEKRGRVFHLVCLKRQPDASLEVHLFSDVRTPATAPAISPLPRMPLDDSAHHKLNTIVCCHETLRVLKR